VLVVEREVLELLDEREVLLDLLHHHVRVPLAQQELEQDEALDRVVLVRAVLHALPDEGHDRGELDPAAREVRRRAVRSARAQDAEGSSTRQELVSGAGADERGWQWTSARPLRT
jgi:hypothetical protein